MTLQLKIVDTYPTSIHFKKCSFFQGNVFQMKAFAMGSLIYWMGQMSKTAGSEHVKLNIIFVITTNVWHQAKFVMVNNIVWMVLMK